MLLTRFKFTLVALASAVMLIGLVSSASANRLAQSAAQFKISYAPMSIIPAFGNTVRCPVTIEGSLHSRTFSKTAGALIGYINRVTVGLCETGRLRANTETLPSHYQYAGFNGTLPNFFSKLWNAIRLSWEVQGEIFGLRVICRYTTPSQRFTDNRESRGAITSEVPGTESTSSETEGCPSVRFSGTGSVTTPENGILMLTLV